MSSSTAWIAASSEASTSLIPYQVTMIQDDYMLLEPWQSEIHSFELIVHRTWESRESQKFHLLGDFYSDEMRVASKSCE